jgi:MarR family transcriptional regulator for hemolysin
MTFAMEALPAVIACPSNYQGHQNPTRYPRFFHVGLQIQKNISSESSLGFIETSYIICVHLITQLIESSRFLRNYVDHRAKSRGTTRAQWIVLFRLREQEGLSQVDLADVLELQPISLVRLLDRLVEHGLVERRSDPRDRRANRLFLTASGRQLADDLDSLRDSIATDVLQGVPAATVETSLKALRDVKERIKSLAEPAGGVAAK